MKPRFLFSSLIENTQPDTINDGCTDADCACPTPVVVEASNLTRLQKFRETLLYQDWRNGRLESPLEGKILIQSKHQWQCQKVDADHNVILSSGTKPSIFVLNTLAQEILDFFSQPRDPTVWPRTGYIDYRDAQLVISRFYEAGLLREVSAPLEVTPFNHTASQLQAWLYLTRACNLYCAHCFVNKDIRRMSLETGLQTVDFLFDLAEKHRYLGVKIKYAGGEPTMNWNLILAIHERARFCARETGVKLAEVLVTNATLLNNKRVQFIKDENFRLAISLDGFGEGHDRQRPLRNGNPTFQRVLQSILLALKAGLLPYLIITITRLNLEEVPMLVAFALEHRLMLNLNFYRPHYSNDPLACDNIELTRVLRDALKVIESNLPAYNIMEGLIDHSNFGAAHQYVCGAGRNYLSIDTNGSVLPCHMLTGYNLLGILPQTVDSPSFNDFPNPLTDDRNECKMCEWRYWCGGGCPIHAKNILGTSNAPSPYCSVYKSIYPELVRLQALQLLQADLSTQ
jgi:uncharacterized protein